MQPIYTQTVGAGGASSVVFNNIPQTFTDFKVVISARSLASAPFANVFLALQTGAGDTLHSYNKIQGYAGSAAAFRASGGANIDCGYMPAATATASAFSNIEVYVPNYAGANFKSVLVDSVDENNSTTDYVLTMVAGLWRSTSPVTNIIFGQSGGNFAANSTFTLYGITKG